MQHLLPAKAGTKLSGRGCRSVCVGDFRTESHGVRMFVFFCAEIIDSEILLLGMILKYAVKEKGKISEC
jgi:hypothetical protein